MKQLDDLQRLKGTSTEGLPSGKDDGLVVFPASSQPQANLDRMMDSYGASLLRLCFMYLKDLHLAEDAVQEAFFRAYKNYHRFDGGNGEKAWINRIAINVCKDMLRSAWRRRVDVVEQLDEVPDEAPPGYTDEDTTLVQAIMELKPKYKEVVLLFYYQDMKIADIAAALNAPESTISVRLKRAREQLKRKLGGWYYSNEA